MFFISLFDSITNCSCFIRVLHTPNPMLGVSIWQITGNSLWPVVSQANIGSVHCLCRKSKAMSLAACYADHKAWVWKLGSSAADCRRPRPWNSSVLLQLVLCESQVFLQNTALPRVRRWPSVGDYEVVSDVNCRERDGHPRLPTWVASIWSRFCRTLLGWKWHKVASTSVVFSDVSVAIL